MKETETHDMSADGGNYAGDFVESYYPEHFGKVTFTPFNVKKGDKIWGDQETHELIISAHKPQGKKVKLLGKVK